MNHRIHRVREQTIYEINGVRYERLEDVPAEFRAFFEDKDDNGVPDALDSLAQKLKAAMSSNPTSVSIKTASGRVPSYLRQAVQREPVREARGMKIECIRCGYDLSGTAVGGNCPECGMDARQSIETLMARRSSTSLLDSKLTAHEAGFAFRELRRFLTSITVIALLLGFIFLLVKYAL